jgi:DNA-binding NarL/FixJ family response regulator
MPSPENISLNIALIDDHQLLAESLAKLLTKYEFIKEINTYKNPKVYLGTQLPAAPDVILSDILMPEMSGIDLLLHFKKQNIKAKIIFLTSITEVQTIRHAMRSGASGYLAKDTSPDELADAILSVYHGEPYIGESLRKSLIKNTFTEDRFVYNLSPREKEVLEWVCSGKTIKETAYEMGLSVNTIQTYYKSILKKFNLNRTADLIVFAIQNGLYNPIGKK